MKKVKKSKFNLMKVKSKTKTKKRKPRSELTYEAVSAAAMKIAKKNNLPTIRGVCKIIGINNKLLVCQHLKKWRLTCYKNSA